MATRPDPGSVVHTTPPAVECDLGESVASRGRDSLQQVCSREAGDERIARRADELLRRSELEHPAVHQHADSVGQGRGIFEVVRDEQRRHSQLTEELVQLRAHGPAGMGVEGRQRLVEKEYVRLAGQRPGEGDPLALTTGELGGTRVGEAPDPEALEELGHGSPVTRAERDVASDVEVRKKRVLLEDEADSAPLGRHVDPTSPVEPGLRAERDDAALGPEEPSDCAKDARLTGSGGADERHGLCAYRERQLETEGAETVIDVELERLHASTTFAARRTSALATTRRAPIARAVSNATSNSW
jgi:hypothetical protein